ncbi:MAG: branched-chain amino acid transport system ATP-binding protein [Actinomycetota bacterium]|nr:branched-chain amino acid transport system ATP-binding protein [Actinomycetota bacterium]
MFLLDNVTAGYGDTTVLRNVSLRVPAGATVALLGPNGAGKTTLLRVASGLLKPWTGRLLIDGADVTAASPHALVGRGVCHVPEGRGVFPSLTVRENLLLQVSAKEADSIGRAVDAFPILGERMSQVAGTLSGGQQQMLALARAYLSNPSVILLDEVSMGLAPKIVDEIFEFLGRLSEAGSALLLVEQYVTRALAVADYVYMLNKGQVTFCGEPGELNDDDVFASYLSHAV